MTKLVTHIAVPTDRRLRSGTISLPGSPEDGFHDDPFCNDRREVFTRARSVITFAIGERLIMADGGRITARQASACKILAHMPHEGGPQRYRVQSESEGFERVVAENDLSPLLTSAAQRPPGVGEVGIR